MEGWGSSKGALTIVNALPTGKGAALGVELSVTARVRLLPGLTSRVEGYPEKVCFAALSRLGGGDYGVDVEVKSEIPWAVGMKSSSAVTNAIILATADALGSKIKAMDVLGLNAEINRGLGVSRTGALDDAAACLFGGIVVTDNLKDRLIQAYQPEPEVAVFLIPAGATRPKMPEKFRAGVCDCSLTAYSLAMRGNYHEAASLNGSVIAGQLGYSLKPVTSALRNGASSAGITGNGPAYAALACSDTVEKIAGEWTAMGRVIRVRVAMRS
ncbi:MAG: shikimate kinase [Thermoprotei archaeon]